MTMWEQPVGLALNLSMLQMDKLSCSVPSSGLKSRYALMQTLGNSLGRRQEPRPSLPCGSQGSKHLGLLYLPFPGHWQGVRLNQGSQDSSWCQYMTPAQQMQLNELYHNTGPHPRTLNFPSFLKDSFTAQNTRPIFSGFSGSR